MWVRRWKKQVTVVALLVMVVPGFFLVVSALNRQQDEDAQSEATRDATCSQLVDRLVAALDTLVEQFDGLTAQGADEIPPMPSMDTLREEAAAFDTELGQAGCGQDDARDALEEWQQQTGATGPLAEALRLALSANVIDVLVGSGGKARHRLSPDEDLAAVLPGLPSGATVVVPRGRFAVDRTVTVVQDVTIRGAGARRTSVTSSAQGAGVLLASQVSLRMSGVQLEHRGGGTASVLLLRAGAAELDDVRVAGATRTVSAKQGAGAALTGGSGIVLAGAQRLTMSDSTSTRNAVAGLLVATGAPRVDTSTFSDNGVCGVCYVGKSAGRLRDSTIVGNGSGVLLAERSAPLVQANRIEANRQAGLLVEGSARPVVRRNTMQDNAQIGIAVYRSAAPRLIANTLSGHAQAGILVDVTDRVTPRLSGNVLRDNGSAGAVFMGASRGSASGNVCSGSKFGLVLDGSAAPTLGDNDCAIQDQRGESPNS